MKRISRQIAAAVLAGMAALATGMPAASAQDFLQFFEQSTAGRDPVAGFAQQAAPQFPVQNLIQDSAQVLAQNIGRCLDNRAINNARANGRILPLVDILRLAGVSRNANILSVRVCSINGQPFYLVDILRPNGVTRRLVLRASDGAPYIAG